MGLGEYLQKEWDVITRAPATFVVGALLIGGVAWGGATVFYNEKVESARQETATARQERDFWKDKAEARPAALALPSASAARNDPKPVAKARSTPKTFHSVRPPAAPTSEAPCSHNSVTGSHNVQENGCTNARDPGLLGR